MHRCKKCHRKLTSQASKDRGYGPVCIRKEKEAQTELFDDIPIPTHMQAEEKELYEPYPLPQKVSYQIQLGLNFNPIIRQDMSALDKHEMVNRILNLK
jgi:hypothetical protein